MKNNKKQFPKLEDLVNGSLSKFLKGETKIIKLDSMGGIDHIYILENDVSREQILIRDMSSSGFDFEREKPFKLFKKEGLPNFLTWTRKSGDPEFKTLEEAEKYLKENF